MIQLVKEYGRYKLVFKYFEGLLPISSDFEILNIPTIEYGDDNKDEMAFYPANITIEMEQLTAQNYKAIRRLVDLYNKDYPFNFHQLFIAEYHVDGVKKFTGVVNEYSYDASDMKLTLELTDASEYYKNVSIYNAHLLNALGDLGFQRTNCGVNGGLVYAYGWSSAEMVSGNRLNIPDARQADITFRLETLIRHVFNIINPNIILTISTDWKFEDQPFGSLFIDYLYETILGRYLIKRNDFPIANLANENEPEHRHPFRMVWSDSSWSTWIYDEPGVTGLSNKNIIELIKTFLRNFGMRISFSSFDRVSIQKKAHVADQQFISIDDRLKAWSKEKFIRGIKSVRINDKFSMSIHTRGNYADDDPEGSRLEYDIIYSAYSKAMPGGNWITGYNLFCYDGIKRPILNVRDPVLGYTGRMPELIAESEYSARNKHQDKFQLKCVGTEFEHSSLYTIMDENGTLIKLRPINLQIDYENDSTNLVCVQI